MTRSVYLGLMHLLSAYASTDQPAPQTVDWPSGCFELPFDENPDGSAPIACTATNGQNSDQQDDNKSDDEDDTPKSN
ncbi:hypothetical protein PB2503_12184 [Parvularcula bermudensis HTCC2503]|jgi:hypothetical protein|uniref:Uncharacterized protein n=1 Tax=Parvularcula bermudensis (strain ATCC BAA-594 / HTCC2503 / KCTC 12087) TaxID=314260 RepID=E0TEZ2_PARBH|nr:hypothetical protein [Parvularcula bermudensis]ADM10479.1 hypothetical protein PB2503_12184 [Parvularcula bermudensis HTCC2503]MAN46267.1 hypothetical protein [Hyphomonas sp.]MBR9806604.1 hypothetical protein [Alphaproteobacteria bacterium]|tara:strand:+ start:7765 stop:7995 length:231 start_codon:yes stop_codon:yes gene_type:complete